MLGLEIKFLCVCLALKLSALTVSGYVFKGPCVVRPRYPDGIGLPESSDFTIEVKVPATCRKGAFIWSYPRGHTMVTFNNTRKALTSICVRDRLGGHIFTITDTTKNEVVAPFEYDHWACTNTTNKREIVLKVDAPDEWRYFGAFEYKLVRKL